MAFKKEIINMNPQHDTNILALVMNNWGGKNKLYRIKGHSEDFLYKPITKQRVVRGKLYDEIISVERVKDEYQ